jgi:hypothetical protein
MPSILRRHSVRARWLVPVLVLVAGIATPAGADTQPAFSATVLPRCAPASSSVTFTATLTNGAGPQSLGSANITAPLGFTVTSIVSAPAGGTASFSSGVVFVRNLSVAPGGSATVAFQATTPVAGAYTWHDPAKFGAGTIEAKASRDFSGTGMQFDAGPSSVDVFVGTCSLRFVTEPADARIGQNVTAEAFDPDGAPVQVEVLDGSGQRMTTLSASVSLSIVAGTGSAGAALTPATPTAALVGGVATFDVDAGTGFSISPQGLDFQIQAGSLAGIAPATSQAFDIVNDGEVCSGAGCDGQATAPGGTIVTVTAPNAQPGDVITVLLDVEGLTCPGYTPLSGVPVVTFSVTGNSNRIITIIVPAALATRPVNQDRVCYASELPFVDRNGVTTTLGVLPFCSVKDPAIPPCQRATRVDKNTGAHVITFLSPPGSTRGRT